MGIYESFHVQSIIQIKLFLYYTKKTNKIIVIPANNNNSYKHKVQLQTRAEVLMNSNKGVHAKHMPNQNVPDKICQGVMVNTQ